MQLSRAALSRLLSGRDPRHAHVRAPVAGASGASGAPDVTAPPPGAPREGPAGIAELGHREYVGGLWEEVGALQFAFLIAEGLRPEHCLLDIGCGALRGGVRFIPYLAPGNYLGLDKEPRLLALGLSEEVGATLAAERRPELIAADDFAFERFSRRPDYSLAQSLFTHLAPDDVVRCLTRLRAVVAPGHRFLATFFEGDPVGNAAFSHSHLPFRYPRTWLEDAGRAAGWEPVYIGAWGHPRDQRMMRFVAVARGEG